MEETPVSGNSAVLAQEFANNLALQDAKIKIYAGSTEQPMVERSSEAVVREKLVAHSQLAMAITKLEIKKENQIGADSDKSTGRLEAEIQKQSVKQEASLKKKPSLHIDTSFDSTTTTSQNIPLTAASSGNYTNSTNLATSGESIIPNSANIGGE